MNACNPKEYSIPGFDSMQAEIATQRQPTPLLLLYDAKTPRGQKIKEFNCLGDDPFNASISLF